jgi:nucleotide sugar dehydrogenase
MGLNVWEVLDAAATKPFGFTAFYPGPGVGGHCIPIDPHYLEWKARELDFDTRFIKLAGEINRGMPEFVLEKAKRALAAAGAELAGAKVLVLGVAYKPDVDDCRKSPAIAILHLLRREGVAATYHDPHVPRLQDGELDLESAALSDENIAAQDLVIIATHHSRVDYERIVRQARQVLDTRNATRGISEGREKITLL